MGAPMITYTNPSTGERVVRPMSEFEERMWSEDQKSHMAYREMRKRDEIRFQESTTNDSNYYKHRDTGEGCGWMPDYIDVPWQSLRNQDLINWLGSMTPRD